LFVYDVSYITVPLTCLCLLLNNFYVSNAFLPLHLFVIL